VGLGITIKPPDQNGGFIVEVLVGPIEVIFLYKKLCETFLNG